MAYQPMSLYDFVRRFGTTNARIDAIIERRWPQGWSCPKCGGTRSYRLQSRRALQCADPACCAQISVTNGTVFEQLKIPLPKVFLGIYLMTDKQGISAMALSKHLDGRLQRGGSGHGMTGNDWMTSSLTPRLREAPGINVDHFSTHLGIRNRDRLGHHVGQCMVYTHAVPLFGALMTTMHQAGSPAAGA